MEAEWDIQEHRMVLDGGGIVELEDSIPALGMHTGSWLSTNESE